MCPRKTISQGRGDAASLWPCCIYNVPVDRYGAAFCGYGEAKHHLIDLGVAVATHADNITCNLCRKTKIFKYICMITRSIFICNANVDCMNPLTGFSIYANTNPIGKSAVKTSQVFLLLFSSPVRGQQADNIGHNTVRLRRKHGLSPGNCTGIKA